MSESKTPEDRLDQLFLAAFGTNEAAMLDWVQIKFQLKEFRTKLQKMHRRAQRSESEANKLIHGVGTRAARYWQSEWSMVNARYKKARTDTERRTKRGAELEAYSAAVFPSSESNTPETSKVWAALLVVGVKYGFSEALLRSMAADMGAMEIQRNEARETLDLMCDEFQRIKALNDLPLEAHTFCDRAISGIKQRVPLIEQRDRAEEARRVALARVDKLRKRVEELVSGHQGTTPPAAEILDPARRSNVGSEQGVLLGPTPPEIVNLLTMLEWYKHTGGPCPCAPETTVNYITRIEWQHGNYDLSEIGEEAGTARWNHANGPGDILFWRPAGAPSKLSIPIKVKFVGRIELPDETQA